MKWPFLLGCFFGATFYLIGFATITALVSARSGGDVFALVFLSIVFLASNALISLVLGAAVAAVAFRVLGPPRRLVASRIPDWGAALAGSGTSVGAAITAMFVLQWMQVDLHRFTDPEEATRRAAYVSMNQRFRHASETADLSALLALQREDTSLYQEQIAYTDFCSALAAATDRASDRSNPWLGRDPATLDQAIAAATYALDKFDPMAWSQYFPHSCAAPLGQLLWARYGMTDRAQAISQCQRSSTCLYRITAGIAHYAAESNEQLRQVDVEDLEKFRDSFRHEDPDWKRWGELATRRRALETEK